MDANGAAKETGKAVDPVNAALLVDVVMKLKLEKDDILIVNTRKVCVDHVKYFESLVENPILGVEVRPGEEIQDALARWPKELIIAVLEALKG